MTHLDVILNLNPRMTCRWPRRIANLHGRQEVPLSTSSRSLHLTRAARQQDPAAATCPCLSSPQASLRSSLGPSPFSCSSLPSPCLAALGGKWRASCSSPGWQPSPRYVLLLSHGAHPLPPGIPPKEYCHEQHTLPIWHHCKENKT